LEQHHGRGHQGQTKVRWRDEDGTEYLQFYWNGKPASKVCYAWMFDAWDEDSLETRETIE
jgi:hypothetical protein